MAAKRNSVRTNNQLRSNKKEGFSRCETLFFFVNKSFLRFSHCNGKFFNFGKENNLIL